MALAYVAWLVVQRPRGWSSPAVEVRDSSIHGKGVFAKKHIPNETIIGSYPGRVRTSQGVRPAHISWQYSKASRRLSADHI